MTSAVMATYDRYDVAFERGEGAWLTAADGRRFLDFGAGVAVNALGHCHPRLVEALCEQAHRFWHCSNLYRIPDQERLAARLAAASFADAAFFCNSGAEAIECGLKLVRKYQDMAGAPERYRVITFVGAFHGRTLATIAAGGSEKYLAGYEPTVEGFDQVAFADLDAVRAAIGPETAAILIEPMQGEGGIRPVPTAFLRSLRALADEHGLLLFFDEVQCGIGRTGRLFAHEWAGVTPDVMALAKGLGGGFPIGACLATDRVAAAFAAGAHGSTFGGNPLAMSVGNAVLDVVLADGFLARVQETSAGSAAPSGRCCRTLPDGDRRGPRPGPDAGLEVRHQQPHPGRPAARRRPADHPRRRQRGPAAAAADHRRARGRRRLRHHRNRLHGACGKSGLILTKFEKSI